MANQPRNSDHGDGDEGGEQPPFGQGLAHDVYADGVVNAVVATPYGAYVGGYFDQAGPVHAESIAEWRDGVWRDMGGGVQMPSALGTVHAMLAIGGDLYVTGTAPPRR